MISCFYMCVTFITIIILPFGNLSTIEILVLLSWIPASKNFTKEFDFTKWLFGGSKCFIFHSNWAIRDFNLSGKMSLEFRLCTVYVPILTYTTVQYGNYSNMHFGKQLRSTVFDIQSCQFCVKFSDPLFSGIIGWI